jgi:hypothetical protein
MLGLLKFLEDWNLGFATSGKRFRVYMKVVRIQPNGNKAACSKYILSPVIQKSLNQAGSRLIKVNQGLLKHFFPGFCANLRYLRAKVLFPVPASASFNVPGCYRCNKKAKL